jgi:pimeloyl-ACP methyl ester carboxylesterase
MPTIEANGIGIYYELHGPAGVELALITHAGHAALWEQSGVFNTLILGFLAKHSGR